MFSLVIDDVQPEDAGEYECVAINDYGETSTKAFLNFEQNGITPELIEEAESAPITLDEVEAKPQEIAPEILEALKPVEVMEGESLTLETRVSGKPAPTVEWLKDNIKVKETRNVKTELIDNVAKLIIKQTRGTDKGEYTCVVKNDVGSTSTKAKVTIRVPVRPDFTVKLKPTEVVEGGEARFTVQTKGEPKPEVEWYKGTTKIVDEGRYQFEETDDGKYTLIIVDVNHDDSGAYKCTATNEIGKATTRGDLTVKERQFAPEIEGDQEGPIIVKKGDEVNIKVVVKGKPKPEVKWYKDGKPLRDTTRLDIRSRGDSYYIVILSSKPEDAGTYKCEATSKLGKASRTFEVQVQDDKGKAPVLDSELKSIETVEGETVKLVCKVSGEPKPTTEWFKDDQPLKPDSRIKIDYDGEESTLTIKSTTLDDEAIYKCVARNDLGSIDTTAELLVNEKPSETSAELPEEKKPVNIVIKDKMKDIKGELGKEAKFDVKVDGTPKPEVEWVKDGNVIEDVGRYLLIDEEEGEGIHSLVIDEIVPEDAGLYKCIVFNETGELETSANLILEDDSKAPEFDKGPEGPIVVTEGETIDLNAEVTGKPLPETEWQKDDKPIKKTSNVEMIADGNKFKLVIVKVTTKDTGKYKCVARSSAGVAEKNFEVIVNVKKPEGAAPSILESLKPVEVSEGDDAVLECKVSGTPTPTVEWFKGAVRVKESRRVKAEISNDVAKLTIKSTQANDQGDYKCVVRNDFGSTSSKSKLTVKVPIKPDFTTKLKPTEVTEGNEARFEIRLKGEPKPEVEWYKGTTKIVDEGRYQFEETDDGKYTLIIVDVNRDDAGTYKCTATNEAGKATTRAELIVKERQFAPEIEGGQEGPIIVNESDEVNIKVVIKGNPKPEVKWYKDDKPLRDTSRLDIRSRGDTHYIVIISAKIDDTGTYKCEASSKLGKASKTFDVKVRGPKGDAPSVTTEMKPVEVVEGQETKLVCKIKGKPEPTIEWLKDDKPLKTDRRVKVDYDGETSTLIIKETVLDDEALYKCVATNKFGEVSTSAELLVEEKGVKPDIEEDMKDVVCALGKKAKFEVKIQGKPKPEVEWFKNGKQINDGGRFQVIAEEEDNLYSLVINKVEPEDVAAYKCVAFNELGEVETTASLTLEEELVAPEFISKGGPVTVTEGESVDIETEVKGKPLPEVEWFKDNKPLRKTKKIDMKSIDNKFTLVMVDVTPDDSGIYKCVARSKAGVAEQTIEVVVERKKGTAPEIIDEMRPVEVNEGENATLECTVTGKPAPSVEWMKDGIRIKESRRVKCIFESNTASLTIKQTRDDDKGVYKCIVKNDFGKTESTSKLTVIVPKRPDFKLKMKPVSGIEGGEARFDVRVEGLPKPEIEWFHGSTPIFDGQRFQIIEEEEDNCYSLIVTDLKLSDSGPYKCIATNDVGKATSRADLDVKEKQFAPEIQAEDKGPIIVTEGEEVNIDVLVKGKPKPDVEWFKDERTIFETAKRDIKVRGDSHSLLVLSSKLEDTGTYKCVASNKIGKDTRTFDVRVQAEKPKGEAPVITSKLKEVEITEGEDVVLVCEFSGKPEPTCEWSKDGLSLKPGGRIRIKVTDTSSTITIKESTLDDEGHYKCTVRNEFGSATTSTEVLVNEKEEGAGPRIVENLKDIDAVLGQNVKFSIRVSDTAEVDWFRNEELVEDSGRFIIVDNENEGLFELEIEDVHPEDIGTYKCVVFNESGEASSTARLGIQEEAITPEGVDETESSPLKALKPEIIEPLKSVEVKEGDEAVLVCKVFGTPSTTVQWEKNNLPVRESYRVKGKFEDNVATLTLKQTRGDDSGEYKCIVSNEHGTDSSSCKLTVVVPIKPSFKTKLQPLEVVEGSKARFEVEIEGFPKPDVEWYHGTTKIVDMGRYTFEEDNERYTLIINSTILDDSGAYKCVASNDAGKSTSRSDLTVKEREFAPEITGGDDETIYVNLNQEVNIKVTVKGKPKPEVKWYKDGKPVRTSLNTEVRSRGESHSFEILRAKPEDAGIYKCEAKNKHGTDYKTFTLKVGEQKPKGEAPVLATKLAPVEVTEGEEAILFCDFSGTPEPTCEWLKDGVEMKSDDRVAIEYTGKSCTVTIKETITQDEGTYKCVLRNEFGSTSTSADVVVNEKELGEGPTILEKLRDITVKIGQEANFKIRVSLPAEVDWYKGEDIIEDSGRFIIIDDEDSTGLFQLTVEDVQPEDIGRYKCVVFNEDGEVSCKAKLALQEEEVLAPETMEETEAAPEPLPDMKPLGTAPTVTEPLKSVEVSDGDTAVLKCKVSGTPVPSVEWFQNNAPVKEGWRIKSEYKNDTATLTIKQSKEEDAGSYKCVIRNDLGETSTSAKLTIKVLTKPSFTTELTKVEVEEGEEARFVAGIECYPKPEVEWLVGGTKIDDDGNYEIIEDEENDTYTLVISNVKMRDAGNYKCVASNEVGRATSRGELVVNENLFAPQFEGEAELIIVRETHETTITAIINAKPKAEVTWYKDGIPLRDSIAYDIKSRGNTYDCVILRAKSTDAGLYKCEAMNTVGTASRTYEVQVKAAAAKGEEPSISGMTKRVEVTEESPAKLVCKVFGTPQPTCKWTKNNVTVKTDGRVKIDFDGTSSTLSFKETRIEDEGVYKITATNDLGSASSTSQLLVNELGIRPKFEQKLKNINVVEGEEAKFQVRLSGIPAPEVEWMKESTKIRHGGRYKIIEENMIHSLVIEDCKLEDSGKYECIAFNSTGEVKSRAQLNVEEEIVRPEFVGPAEEPIVKSEGESVEMTVEVTGKPMPEVEWYHYNTNLRKTTKIDFKVTDNRFTLVLVDLSRDDSGMYRCVAKNKVGQASRSFDLEVQRKKIKGEAPEIIDSLKPVEVTEGEAAELVCTVSGKPTPTIEWFKDSLPVKESRRVRSEFDGNTVSLIFVETRGDDSGQYKCVVRNELGSAPTTAKLKVIIPTRPEFVEKLKNIEVNEGEEAQLEVRIKSYPRPEIEWYQGSTKIVDIARYEIIDAEDDDDTYSLIISRCQLDDASVYKCVATNEAGKSTCRGELVVKEKQTIPSFPGDEETTTVVVNEGEELKLSVSPSGKPKPDVTWYKENNMLVESSRRDIRTRGDDYIFVVLSAKPEDAGKYKCEASNRLGKTTKHFIVKVRATEPEGEAPRFITKMKPQEVNEDEDVKFICSISGTPKPNVTWSRDGEVLSDGLRFRTDISSAQCILTIHGAKLEDEGIYKCALRNEFGSATTTAELIVNQRGKRPKFEKKLANVEGKVGHEVRFQVRVSGAPPPDIEFFHENIKIEDGGRCSILEEEEGYYTLIVRDTKAEDGGQYKCTATNKIGEVSSRGYLLLEEDVIAPEFIADLEGPINLIEGESCELNVEVTGKPTPEIEWYRNERLVWSTSKIQLVSKDSKFKMAMVDLTVGDSGMYKCVARNKGGIATTTVKVNVEAKKPEGNAPEIIEQLKPVEVDEGESAQLKCVITGKPTPKLEWFKDGLSVKETRRVKSELEDGVVTLTIKETTDMDMGNYKCVIRNELGKVTTSARLEIRVSTKPEFKTKLKPQAAIEGETVRLEVRVKGFPTPKIEWYQGTTMIVDEGRHQFDYNEDRGSHSLIISNVTMEDAGTYKCVALNRAGKATCRGELDVAQKQFAPRFEEPEQTEPTVLSPEADATIKATVLGNPQPSVTWYKDGIPTYGSLRADIRSRGNIQFLKLSSVKPEDAGTYKCEAKNRLGSASRTFVVKVEGGKLKGEPPQFLQRLQPTDVIEGETIRLACLIYGKPQPTVEWFKDDLPVRIDWRTTTEYEKDVCTLRIKEAKQEDEGIYKCTIKNIHGSVSSSAEVTLSDKESRPRIIEKLQNVESVIGESGTFRIRVLGTPKPEVEWFKDDVQIESEGRLRTEKEGRGYFSLTICDIIAEDEGLYKCVATNELGEVISKAELQLAEVMMEPSFIGEEAEPITDFEGSDFDLTVYLRGRPLPNVTFYKDELPVIVSDRLELSSRGNRFSLNITNLIKRDSGTYKIVAKNKAGTATRNVELTVKPKKTWTPGQSPPEIVAPLKATLVSQGSPMKMRCRISGDPTPTVEWFKNSLPLATGDRVTTGSTGDMNYVNFLEVKNSDEGRYRCVATNEVGSVSTTADLTVESSVRPPSFKLRLMDVEASEGEETTFVVKVKGPTDSVKWYYNDELVENGERFQIERGDEEGEFVLIIPSTTKDDEGTYQCVARNESGKASTKSELQVLESLIIPSFVGTGEAPMSFREGDDVSLDVEVRGRPAPEITWYKDDLLALESSRLTIRSRYTKNTLKICDVTTKDSGWYKCVARSKAGSSYRIFNVDVAPKKPRGFAPEFFKQLKRTEVEHSATAKFEAKVSGQPEPTIEWTKDGEVITSSPQFRTYYDGEVCKLTIFETKDSDSGEYTCVATNDVGFVSSKAQLVVKEPIVSPEFKKKMENTTVVEEKVAEFVVRVVGNPEPTIEWTKAGKKIRGDSHFQLRTVDKNTYKLVIKHVTLDDLGTYKCVASNEAGRAQCSARLDVTEKMVPPKIISDLPERTMLLSEGDDLQLHTTVEGNPVPEVEWYKDGILIRRTERINIFPAGNRYSLTVRGLVAEDTGVFKCLAKSAAGTFSKSFTVVVESKKPAPLFIEPLQEQEVVEGKDTRMECRVRGTPRPMVEWLKDGRNFREDYHIYTEFDGNSCVLIVKGAKTEHDGLYECIAKNKEGRAKSGAKLIVKEDVRLPTFDQPLQDLHVTESDKVTMKVLVSGKPAPTVDFYKGEELLVRSGRIRFEEDHDTQAYTLSIRDCIPSDSGEYSCVLRNKAGETSCEAELTVKPRISVPSFTGGPGDIPIDVWEGVPVQLVVEVKGKPPPTIEWFKEKRQAKRVKRVQLLNEGNKYMLVIPKAVPEDAGEYHCEATNSAGVMRKTFKVTVNAQSVVLRRQPVPPGSTKPEFIQRLQDQEIIEGSASRFTVRLRGIPEPDVDWYKDNKVIREGGRIEFEFQDDGSCILVIRDALKSDRGRYKCVASNTAGKAQCSAELFIETHGFESGVSDTDMDFAAFRDQRESTIELLTDESSDEVDAEGIPYQQKLPPEITLVLRNKDINEGGVTKFACRVISKTPMTVQWFKDETHISNELERFSFEHDEDLYALNISQVKVVDSGPYKIVATNEFGSVESVAYLNVQSAMEPEFEGTSPRFLIKLKDVTAADGTSVRLECQVTGAPTPEVRWYRDNEPLIEGEKYQFQDSNEIYAMIINDVTEEDAGNYKVVARNSAGREHCTADVTVKHPETEEEESDTESAREKARVAKVKSKSDVPKPEILLNLRDRTVVEGMSVRFNCRTSSTPKPYVLWYKDDHVIGSYGRYEISSMSGTQSLVIRDCQLGDVGTYKCQVTNLGGEAHTTARLTVEELPKSRPSVVATAPRFLEELRGAVTVVGSTARLSAKLTGHPKPSIEWYRDDREVLEGGRIRFEEAPGGQVTLVVRDARLTDQGRYKCLASNRLGRDFSSSSLIITELIPSDDEEEEGLSRESRRSIKEAVKSLPKIPSEELLAVDTPISQSTPLRPRGEPPEFIRKLRDQTVKENERANFVCLVLGNPEPTYQWYHEDNLLSDNEQYKMSCEEDKLTLEIVNCSAEDEGMYKCEATNQCGKDMTSARLNVKVEQKAAVVPEPESAVKVESEQELEAEPQESEPESQISEPEPVTEIPLQAEDVPQAEEVPEETTPTTPKGVKPSFVKKVENCKAVEGGRARFDVKVSGYPEPFVDWFTRGKMIEESEIFRIEETEEGDCALIINDVDREDAGIYKCVAENDEGTISCEAELIVEVPDEESETESIEDDATRKQPSKTAETKPPQPEAPKPYSKPSAPEAPAPVTKPKPVKKAALPKPTFTSELADKQVKQGDNLSLDVKIPSECKADVSWYRDDTLLKEDHRITIISAGDLHCLTIFGVAIKDEAVYKVVATNSTATTYSDCEVLVEERIKVPQYDSRRLSQVAPEFIEECESQTVTEKGTAIFKIKALGSQPLSIRWFKDQQTIKYGGRIKMSSDGENCTLKISPVEKKDEGLYMCVISNKAGTADCEVLLTVEPMESVDDADVDGATTPKSKDTKPRRTVGEKPTIVTPLSDLDVFEGDDIVLEVTSGPEPIKKVEWFKDNELIRSQPRYNVMSESTKHTLTISRSTFDDEGIFKCVLLNDYGIASCSAEVLVDSETDSISEVSSADESVTDLRNARRRSRDSVCGPEFQQELKDREVLEGDTIHFDVRISGRPEPKVTWSKDGKELVESSRITFVSEPETGLYSLLIKKASFDDEGDYRVVASNSGGSISCQAELLVEDLESDEEEPKVKEPKSKAPKPKPKDEAPVFTALLKDRSIESGSAARFDARAIGNPNPKVTWYKDDKEITPSAFPHMKVLDEGDLHSLLITEGTSKDSGVFKCVAKNSAGQDSTIGKLYVEGPGFKPISGDSKPVRKSSGLARIEDVLKPQLYIASEDFRSEETGKKFLIKGDQVEVLDTSRPEFWLVRRVSRGAEIGFVKSNVLTKESAGPEEGKSTLTPDEQKQRFISVMNYTPKLPGELTLREGDTLTILDDRDMEKWLISLDRTGEVGWAPAIFLESAQLQTPSTGKQDALARRQSIVNELIETEREYVENLQLVTESHMVELDADDIPDKLVGQKERFFANFKDIYEFHSKTFLTELEACVNNPENIPNVFMKYKSELKMYIDFIESRPAANEILEDEEVKEFWEEFKEDMGNQYFISDYFKKPSQRLQDYQRLIRMLLMFTVRANLDYTTFVSSLEMVADLPRQASERIHKFHTIENYQGEVPLKDLGRLIRQETMLFWEERARGKGKERDLFLFEKALVNTKRKEGGKKYICKNVLKLSTANVGLTENVDGEPTHFMVWVGSSMANALVLHTFETKSTWSKQAWVRDLKRLLKLDVDKPVTTQRSQTVTVEKKTEATGPLVTAFKETVTSSALLDIVAEVEKQYVAITPPDSPEPPPNMNVELGGTYQIHEDTVAKDTQEVVIGRGETVRVLRSGKDLFFVQTTGETKEVKEGWIPASWLVGDDQKQEFQLSSQLRAGISTSTDTLSSEASEPELQKLAESDESEPIFSKELEDTHVNVGNPVRLECSNKGKPTPKIEWFVDEDKIKEGKRFSFIREEPDVYALCISECVIEDEGEYMCKATNRRGTCTTVAELTVDAPAKVEKPADPATADTGGKAVIECSISGNPVPTATWYKGDKCLQNDSRIQIQTQDDRTILTITKVHFRDEGEYTCVVKNDGGHDTCRIELIVDDPDDEDVDPKTFDLPKRDRICLATDKKFEQKYDSLAELGKGKFGVVKKVKNKETGEVLAAKFIKTSAESKKEVLGEMEMMNHLHSKRLIYLADAYERPGEMIVIMELVTGGELFEKICQDDNLTEKEVIRYMRQILQGVEHMHRNNMVHLDLKPENVLCVIRPDGKEDLKLIDFGMAHILEKGKDLKLACGTPEFVAPEVIGYEPVHLASDMWSVGVIAYVLLSGLSPFMGDDDNETIMNVSSAEWDFEDESFEVVSDLSKKFIEELLIQDYRKRNDIYQCLSHEWLKKGKTMEAKKLSTDNLKKFIARRRWQKTSNALRALSRLGSLGLGGGGASSGGGGLLGKMKGK